MKELIQKITEATNDNYQDNILIYLTKEAYYNIKYNEGYCTIVAVEDHPIIVLLDNQKLNEYNKLKILNYLIKVGIANIQVHIEAQIKKNILNYLITSLNIIDNQSEQVIYRKFIEIILFSIPSVDLDQLLRQLDSENQTALAKAVENDDIESANILLTAGARPNMIVISGIKKVHNEIVEESMSLLSLAIINKNNEMIKLLVKSQNDSMSREDRILLANYIINNINKHTVILFNQLAMGTQVAIIKALNKQKTLLLSKLLDYYTKEETVIPQNFYYRFFMYYSLRELESFKLAETHKINKLIDQFIDLYKVNAEKLMGLLKQPYLNEQAIISFLEHDVWVNYSKDPRSVLLYYIMDGGLKCYSPDNPLYLAVFRQSHSKIIKSLLKYGADINIKNQSGISSLHCAVYKDNEEIVKLLLENGADVNVRDNEGATPLHLTVSRYHNRGAITKILLKYGADVNAKDKRGNTALDIARQYLYEDDIRKESYLWDTDYFPEGIQEIERILEEAVKQQKPSTYLLADYINVIYNNAQKFCTIS